MIGTVVSSVRSTSKGQGGVKGGDVIPIVVTRGSRDQMSVSVRAKWRRGGKMDQPQPHIKEAYARGGGGRGVGYGKRKFLLTPPSPSFLKHLSGPTVSRLVFFSQSRVG